MIAFMRNLYQRTVEPGSHSLIGVSFYRGNCPNVVAFQAFLQPPAHAASDENINGIKRMGCEQTSGARAFVIALFFRQFKQLLVLHLFVVNGVQPKLAAFSGMTRDDLTVLTGDCDFLSGLKNKQNRQDKIMIKG